jgi:hypothetical protein
MDDFSRLNCSCVFVRVVACLRMLGYVRGCLGGGGQAAELKRYCMDFILRHSKEVELDSLSCEPLLLLEITRVLMSRQKPT